MNDQRFPRQLRLRRQAEFDRVYASEAYAADQLLVVRGCVNGRDYSRLGLSVSRKVGSAVLRNRWKRLLREAFRSCREAIPAGFDFVVRPRRGAEPDLAEISKSLPRLSRRVAQRLKSG